MMGFSSTVLQTVPESPPQYVAGALLIASDTAWPSRVFLAWGMLAGFLFIPKGPVQRVAAQTCFPL
jgi:hypothetical protein